ncbi:hypothetical protein Bxe_C0224 [Paraburkholderia xenovorans LB400]|uniref:Uncharacterized protein n=1 Tax=Paraburkholderia xenovorans (strain LB400) TaxID=266265 RepID=Q13IE1_PARXL|nr:hypothetical protein Bxe_C0224 [Paraburkholderia xenovorans LB400]
MTDPQADDCPVGKPNRCDARDAVSPRGRDRYRKRFLDGASAIARHAQSLMRRSSRYSGCAAVRMACLSCQDIRLISRHRSLMACSTAAVHY